MKNQTLFNRKNLQLQGHLVDYLKKCRGAGESCYQISEKLSKQAPAVSYASVWRWCQELGIGKGAVESPWEEK